jgi:hypothetical protein
MIAPSLDSETAILQCPSCRSPLKVARLVSSLEERCPVCRAETHLTTFPRLYGNFAGGAEDAPASENEATCSFFPALRAQLVCDECGTFLSHRASTRWGGEVLCLPCLHRLREVEKSPDFIAKSMLHDRRALFLVTWLAPFTLFTAPLAIFLLLSHRGKPEGFVPRGRTIWWIAMTLAAVWLTAWLVLIVVWISLVRDSFA